MKVFLAKTICFLVIYVRLVAGKCDGRTIRISAAGIEGVRLGAVLDARSMRVLGGAFWSESKMRNFTGSISVNDEDTKVEIQSNIRDRLNLLDIDAQLTVDIVSAGVLAHGAAKYVNKEKRDKNVARVAYKTKRVTVAEYIQQELFDELQPFNRFGSDPRATHVVTRILYGAMSIINFDRETNSTEDVMKFEGEMKVKIKAIALDAFASIKIEDSFKETFTNLEVGVSSDIPTLKVPLTLPDAIEVISATDTQLQSVNGGKGVPLEMTLTPICQWTDDPLGKIVKALTQEAIDGVLNVVLRLESSREEARTLAHRARGSGLPTLSYMCEDFEQAVKQFSSLVKQRIVQLLPVIRGDLGSQQELISFMSNITSSPFNGLATSRWLETVEEVIVAQNKLRQDVKDEALNENGDFRKREIRFINRYSELQRILIRPDVETVVVLTVVNRDGGLEKHLKVMKDFVSAPPRTEEDRLAFPNSFDKEKYLESPKNAERTRLGSVTLAYYANKGGCIMTGCSGKEGSEVLAVIDYNSFLVEFLSIGAKTDETSLFLYRGGLLVNMNFHPCASPSDPRDQNGACLWTGKNDIPNGFRCAVGLPQGGCQGVCGRDARCQVYECDKFEDWFMLRSDVSAKTVREDELIVELLHSRIGLTDPPLDERCLTYNPDVRGSVAFELCVPRKEHQKWRWGEGEFANHIVSQVGGNLCLEAVRDQDAIGAEDDDIPTETFAPSESPTTSPTQTQINEDETRSPTSSPTKTPTGSPTMSPTLSPTVIGEPFFAPILGFVVLRECTPRQTDQQWQRESLSFDKPRIRLLPPSIEPFDYRFMCITMTLPSDPRLQVSSVRKRTLSSILLTKCDERDKLQVAFETFVLRAQAYGTGELFWEATSVLFSGDSTILLRPRTEENNQLFYWRGSRLHNWQAGESGFHHGGVVALSGEGAGFVRVREAQSAVDQIFVKDRDLLRSSVSPGAIVYAADPDSCNLDEPCIRWSSPEDSQVGNEWSSSWFQCPGECTPSLCLEARGIANGVCTVMPNGGFDCPCAAGWAGQNCTVQVNSCVNEDGSEFPENPCDNGQFCVDLLPPAPNGPDGRECAPLTECSIGQFVLVPAYGGDKKWSVDRVCSECPADTLQPVYGTLLGRDQACKSKDDLMTELGLDLKSPKESCEKGKGGRYFPAVPSRNQRPRCFYCDDPQTYTPVCDETGFSCSCILRSGGRGYVTKAQFFGLLSTSIIAGILTAFAIVLATWLIVYHRRLKQGTV